MNSLAAGHKEKNLKDGIFGAVVAHFVVVLLIWLVSFGTTITGLYILWFALAPVPIIIGICSGLFVEFLQKNGRNATPFWLAFLPVSLAYPTASLIDSVLVLDLKIDPKPYFLQDIYFGLAYLLAGIIIVLVIVALTLFLRIIFNNPSK